MEQGDYERKRKYLVVVIYDIADNRRRAKVRRFLESYGVRVQRSAFECTLTLSQVNKMLNGIVRLIRENEDLLSIYRLTGDAVVNRWGNMSNFYDDADFYVL